MSHIPYVRSTYKGTTSGYNNTAIVGPLNTHTNVCAMPSHNSGTLIGHNPTPMPLGNMYVDPILRESYKRTWNVSDNVAHSNDTKVEMRVNGKKYVVNNNVNYIPPKTSSERMLTLKREAVGKSAYKVGLPTYAPISNKTYDSNVVHSHIRRMRSSGNCAPRKKTSIYNPVMTVNPTGYGAKDRFTYGLNVGF